MGSEFNEPENARIEMVRTKHSVFILCEVMEEGLWFSALEGSTMF